MASIYSGIYTYLNSLSAITNIFSTSGVHYLRAKKTTELPFLIYRTISDPHKPLEFGSADGNARIQFTIVDSDRFRAINSRKTLYQILDGFSGTMGSSTVCFSTIKNINELPIPQTDLFEFYIDWYVEYQEG